MKVNIFYSWQSQTTNKYNWSFIEEALSKAIKKVKKNDKYKFDEIVIDRDTKGLPGRPNISNSLHEKINGCQIFLADFTVVNKPSWLGKFFVKDRLAINGNVLYETGKATHHDNSRLITVMNSYYGQPQEAIPFDLMQNKWPIEYSLHKNNWNTKSEVIEKLSSEIARDIIKILDEGLKNPHYEHFPFLDWNKWGNLRKGSPL